jgi:hypothetical protein
LIACTVIGVYDKVVTSVIGHVSTACVSHIFSLIYKEYLSCKCCGNKVYISSAALMVSIKHINKQGL